LQDNYYMTMSSSGWLTVASGGLVNLGSYLTLFGPMTNYGTVNVTNNAIGVLNNGTVGYRGGLVNQPGGSINLWGYGGITGSYGFDYFINSGMVIKYSYTGSTAIGATLLDTSVGTVTNLAGTLSLSGFNTNLAGT